MKHSLRNQQPDLRIRRHRSQAEGEMRPAVGEPIEGVDPRGRAESVREP
ncbi:MAG TPA: hypothetical protein VGD71_12610 [Kribbella sp.]